MIEPIEHMCKLVNDNLVMHLRFQMNGELNELEREIEQLKMANALLRKSETAKIERIEQLESLIRDMWREMATCPDYATPPCMTSNICEQLRNLEIRGGRMSEYIKRRES